MNSREQNKYQIGDIVKFNTAEFCGPSVFLHNKRLNTWCDRYSLKNQPGIILEIRSIENTIKPEYQDWYKETKERRKRYLPYLWYCFKTIKTYLVYQYELL